MSGDGAVTLEEVYIVLDDFISLNKINELQFSISVPGGWSALRCEDISGGTDRVRQHRQEREGESGVVSSSNTSALTQVYKADFIQHLKETSLVKQFSCLNPESDEKWNNIAKTAFK